MTGLAVARRATQLCFDAELDLEFRRLCRNEAGPVPEHDPVRLDRIMLHFPLFSVFPGPADDAICSKMLARLSGIPLATIPDLVMYNCVALVASACNFTLRKLINSAAALCLLIARFSRAAGL